jgi:hypothetical protein
MTHDHPRHLPTRTGIIMVCIDITPFRAAVVFRNPELVDVVLLIQAQHSPRAIFRPQQPTHAAPRKDGKGSCNG